MRVLLDECLPRRLKHALNGHEVQTVPEMGWASKRNGELLRLAAREFDEIDTRLDAAEHLVRSAEDTVEKAELLRQKLQYAPVRLVASIQEVDDH